MNPSINKLTGAIAAGDTEAFARFYESQFTFMYAEARRVTGRDEAFCLDIVHDAMVKVIKSLKPMETEAGLKRWLGVAVRSCAYDRLRQEARRRRREESVARPTEPEAREDLHDRLAWLRRELAACDESTRALLTMRLRFGWTLAQIGAAVGLKPGAVDGRLRRTIDAFRQRAKDAFNE